MSEQKTLTDRWWATGDMPVRNASRLAFLIDGRMTMLEMCIAFLRARHSIFITAWGLSPELLLVRGKHTCSGSTRSAEQEAFLAWLRARGLSEEELLFWQQSKELSITNVLSRAVSKGVDVRVLLWDSYALPAQSNPDPKSVQDSLEALGIRCLLDDSQKGLLNHPLLSHHQKTTIVDSRLAFVGGIDVMVENNGDFDRWDTKSHLFYTRLRLGKDGKMPHSWHDVHAVFEGPTVADVELNFRQRWNAVVELHKQDSSLLLPQPSVQLPEETTKTRHSTRTGNAVRLQVTRTIPRGIYSFTQDDGIATILDTYKRAFAQAKRFIYIENQYFWRRTFLGFENPGMGLPHPDMEELLHALAEALARGVVVTLLLPDNPNVGREFTDEGLKFLWELAPQAAASGTLQVYTLGSSSQQQGQMLYRSIYVHAKTTIVDDIWLTLGSANLNNRGMRDDTEMNVAIENQEMARRLRILLMTEHLALCEEDALFWLVEKVGRGHSPQVHEEAETFIHSMKRWLHRQPHQNDSWVATTPSLPGEEQLTEDLGAIWRELESQLGDPLSGLALFAKQAKENLQSIKAGQPFVGHLLPYISQDRAQEYEVNVHAVNGWLDTLPAPQTESASTESASTQ
jgi:phosphatidylserine/phosphatidylglycerophosphate/cardiolipin synthase-like enzyme